MISVHFQSKPFSITVIQVYAPTTEAEEFRKPEIKFEPEIKLPTFAGSQRKQENSRKTSTFALLTTPKPLTVWIIINCGKLLKRWEYQTIFLVSWETCILVKKQQKPVWKNWFRIEKGVWQDCLLSCCLLNLYTEHIMRNVRLDEWQAAIKTTGRSINNLDDTILMAEGKVELIISWWGWKKRVKKLALTK